MKIGMKKKKSIALFLLLALVLGSVVTAFADENWSEAYYRAVDLTGELSDAQRNSLDADCIEFMKTYHLDCSLLAVPTKRYADSSMEELARGMFTENDFGYGEGKDGFSVVYDAETGAAVILCMGAAQGVIEEPYLDFIIQTVPKYQEEYGTYGPLYASLRMLSKKMEQITEEEAQQTEEASREIEESLTEDVEEAAEEAEETTVSETEEKQEAVTEAAETTNSVEEEQPALNAEPNLYDILTGYELYAYIEKNPDADITRGETDYVTQADESRSRVIDGADLLTDEEEAALEKRLAEIRKEIQRDLVVLTDVSCYGHERSVYAADFYDYNGYGCGTMYEGAVLLICMDPSDRGFWTACTGRKTRGAYTEYYANQVDDMLYDYAKASRFNEGITDWAENMRRLLLYGQPFSYDWMNGPLPDSFSDPEAPRVVDDGHLLTSEEIETLKKKARELSDVHDVDVVIHTAYNTADLSMEEYAERFYKALGYGKGDNHSGVLITVKKRSGYSATVDVACFGDAVKYQTGVGMDRMRSRTETRISDDGAATGLSFCLDLLDSQIRKGRVPRSAASWAFSIVCELILGLIVGGILRSGAKKRMDTPKVEENAMAYLVKGSLSIQKLHDSFINSSVSRTRKPRETSSSGGSSSYKSSYKSSYSGSSGRSHSGSGRSF